MTVPAPTHLGPCSAPGSARAAFSLGWTAVGGGAAVLLGMLVSCYDPHVLSGRLRCAAPPAKACPDGFRCVGAVCVDSGLGGNGGGGGRSDAGAADTGMIPDVGTPPDLVAADRPADAPADVMVQCLAPRAGCAPQGGGACDPYCQSGCSGCRDKCSVNATGAAFCTAAVDIAPRQLAETCLIRNRGQASQGDDCAPGLVCVEDCGVGGSAHCYRFCRTDGDCPQSSCSRPAVGRSSARVCEAPFVACNPLDGQQGCAAALESCFLLSSEARPGGATGDRTVCDCAVGGTAIGGACTDSRDCFPGLVCPTSGSGSNACRRVCDPVHGALACPAGGECRRYGATWGYCL